MATSERILDAAERLFAEHGLRETSLRQITGLAAVNLAAVNYHFGSKQGLINAVYDRLLQALCRHWQVQPPVTDNPPPLQQLIDRAVRSLWAVGEARPGGPQRIMRLLSLAYTQDLPALRRHLRERYGADYRQLVARLRDQGPALTPLEFYWRLYFLLGAWLFTLSSFDTLNDRLRDDCGCHSTLADAVNYLVPIATGVLSAPSQAMAASA